MADFERREPYPQKVEKAPSGNGSGQITMRKVDGWQTIAAKLIDQPIDVAA